MIANKKMIAELAAEVKRLTSLLPRRLINESEEHPDESDPAIDRNINSLSKQKVKLMSSQEVQTDHISNRRQRLTSLSFALLSIAIFLLGFAISLAVIFAYKPALFEELYTQFVKEKT